MEEQVAPSGISKVRGCLEQGQLHYGEYNLVCLDHLAGSQDMNHNEVVARLCQAI